MTVIDEANAVAVATAAEVPAPVIPGLVAPLASAGPAPATSSGPSGPAPRRNPRRVTTVVVGPVGSGVSTLSAVQAGMNTTRGSKTQRTPLPSAPRSSIALPAVRSGPRGSRSSATTRGRGSTGTGTGSDSGVGK